MIHLWVADWAYGRRDLCGPTVAGDGTVEDYGGGCKVRNCGDDRRGSSRGWIQEGGGCELRGEGEW